MIITDPKSSEGVQIQVPAVQSRDGSKKKVVFVHNFATHYTSRTFEILATEFDAHFYFFSRGGDWYWMKEHSVSEGNFPHEYLPGFQFGRTRVTPTLPFKLLRSEFDVCVKCINGRFALPITYLVTRMKRRPFILWTGIWTKLNTPLHRALFPLTRYIYHHADAIVVYGAHVKRYLISEGVPAERIFIAPHAVQNDEYQRALSEREKTDLRATLRVRRDQKIILFLGRLEKVKGVEFLIQAFRLLERDDAVLVIAGTGSEGASLQEMVRSKHLIEKVRFTSYIPPEATVAYYAAAWVCVIPSVTTPNSKELWCLTVNEAFNQALPVIATDAVGAAAGGLIEDGVNGFIVPERNSDALAQVLAQVLDDPTLRHRLGRNGFEKISGWTQERMVEGFQEAIAYVMERNRKV